MEDIKTPDQFKYSALFARERRIASREEAMRRGLALDRELARRELLADGLFFCCHCGDWHHQDGPNGN